ncbi:MAG: HU family DNA-binding protein [Pseudomonadales bacterium]
MNKAELVEKVAEAADISKSAAARAVDGMLDAITESLKASEQVSLVGFGPLAVKERAAREGRNPQPGATIQIAAARVPGFKAGKALKDALK